MSEPSRLHRAALAYVRMGWAVFPQKRDKSPYTAHGFKDATSDTAAIDDWWGRWPDANIGIALQPSGLFLFDVDCKRPETNGLDTLARLIERHGDMPVTPTARSGAYAAGRGWHFLFRAFPNAANTDGQVGVGIETKVRGCVTVAPSLHASGQIYEWTHRPSVTPVADAPAWLADWFDERERTAEEARARFRNAPKLDVSKIPEAYVQRAVAGEIQAVSTAGQGGRVTQLYRSSCRLGNFVGAGLLSEAQAWSAMQSAALANGLVKDDGRRSVDVHIANGIRHGAQTPAEVPDRPSPPRLDTRAARAIARPSHVPQLRVVEQTAPVAPPAATTSPDWQDDLILNADGGMKRQSFANAALFVRNLLPGLFAYDAFSHATIVTARPPWALNGWQTGEVADNDASGLRLWLEKQGVSIGEKDAHALINYVAAEHHRHPVRDYLSRLQWDGTPRINTWLEDYLDAPASAFHRAVAAKFMIAAVARVMRPGCKFDNMLVLEGEQGLGKSTAFAALFGDDWTSTGANLFDDAKRMVMLMQGSWCLEIAELAAVKGRAMEKVKALITTQDDKTVAMYAKRATRHPRQCVFVGTVNPGADMSYWDDDTGARRLWPVPVKRVDVAGIRADRDALWAEAVVRFQAGEQWWITDEAVLEEARLAQAERIDADPWVDVLREKPALLVKPILRPTEVWEELGLAGRDLKMAEKKRVANCLKALGYQSATRWVDGKAAKVWERVDA